MSQIPERKMTSPVKVYSLLDETDQDSIKAAVEAAYSNLGEIAKQTRSAARLEAPDQADTGGVSPGEIVKIPPFEDLIGIDSSVYRQIEAALNSGKQHLMFYGPPGTGKTTLARRVANFLNGRNVALITGSADWSSQEIIGGYQPLSGGNVQFFPGVLLRNFDRPLIIDELNRCDIDKVIGPLFTVLSGHSTTLPYRLDAADADSPQFMILPQPKADALPHEYAPSPQWRLLATINSIDKASLYQMSYALSRRFGWIYVDAPYDTKGFVKTYAERALKRTVPDEIAMPPFASIWNSVNSIRRIGAAPIIEAINAFDQLVPGADLFALPTGDMQIAYLDTIELFILPLLDGILRHEADSIASGIIAALGLAEDANETTRLKLRLQSGAV